MGFLSHRDDKEDTVMQDFIQAAKVCLPIIIAVMTEIRNNAFPQGCFLDIEIPNDVKNHKVIFNLLNLATVSYVI